MDLLFGIHYFAEGAYDGIPHPILFMKIIDIVPDIFWRLLYNWYCRLTVRIRWDKFRDPIKIRKGTTQGGLTSTFLFNVFFKDLIDILSNHEGGINIGGKRFNIFCYADDILIISTTVIGLQKMLDSAVQYVSDHGLRFNPSKTVGMVKGNNPLVSLPKLFLNNVELRLDKTINYLGATLGNNCSSEHVSNRISACCRAFFSLQSAGLRKNGLNIKTATYVFLTTCKPILLYACNTLLLNNNDVNNLEKFKIHL